MTPWKWYMVGLTGAVSMSLVAVTLSGALNPAWFLIVPVALYLNYRRALGLSINGFMATVIGLGGFGLGASVVVQLGVDGLVVAGAQTILVLILARLASAETLDHDQQLLALTLTGGPDCHDFEPRSLLRFRSNLLRDFRELGVTWASNGQRIDRARHRSEW